MAKLPLSPEEKALPYSKYYELPFEGIRPEDEAYLLHPLRPEQTMPLAQSARCLQTGGDDGYAANGYCFLPDGVTYTACTVFLPGVTPQMLQWWFVWLNHPSRSVPEGNGNLKYKIWCPADHWDHHFLDEANPDAGMRICESLDLGAGAPRKHIVNKNLPVALMGVDASITQPLERQGNVILFGCGCDERGEPGGVGLTLFAPARGGCVWMSRGWGGYAPMNGKLMRREHVRYAPEADVRAELTHNVLERRHLAVFLPELYRDYHGKPYDMD